MKRSLALIGVIAGLVSFSASAQNYIVSSSPQPYVPLQGATTLPLTASSSSATDDGYGDIQLPFQFPYYGQTFSSVRVDTNGFVVFDPAQQAYLTNNLATTGGIVPRTNRSPHSFVAAWWADLKGSNPTSQIRYVTTPSSVTIEFVDWSYYSAASGSFSFQIRLDASGLIQVHYGTHNSTSKTGITNGFENSTGAQGGNLFSCGATGGCSNADWPTNTLVTVGQPVQPDLAVQQVQVTGASRSGSDVTVTTQVTFRNFGQQDANSFHWKAWLSTNTTYDASDVLLYDSAASGDTVTVLGANNTSNPTTTVSGTGTVSNLQTNGAYYVIVQADSDNAVAEFSENNNFGVTLTQLIAGLDYEATSISNGPANAGPGATVTVTPNFHNLGYDGPGANGAPGEVQFAIYVSRDKTLDSGDQELERVTVNGFGGGSQYSQPQTITLPTNIAGGDVYWILKVDPATTTPPNANPTAESSETNNVAVSAGTTHIQQADLQANSAELVDNLSLQPTRVADFGQPAHFRIEAQNMGDYAAPPYSVGVILSTDTNLSLISDPRLADVSVAPLPAPPGASKTTYDITVTLPTMIGGKPAVTGDYYFFLQLDSFNVINELSESNNVKGVMGAVHVRVPNADYATLAVKAPAVAAGGEQIALTRTFANVGTDDGPATEYRCFASVNSIVTAGDFPLELQDANGAPTTSKPLQLARGQQDSGTEHARLPGSIPAGKYYVGCIVDPAGTVSELDESNNAISTALPITVSAQNFRIVTAQLPDATLGMPYSFELVSVGALGAVQWKAVNSPPEGLGLAADGTLSGSAKKLGVTTFQVEATSGSATATAILVQRVLPPGTTLTISTDNLPPVTNVAGQAYLAALSASGGAAPYTWKLLGGALPNGLTLDGTAGLISGAPKPGLPNGETALKMQVTDALGGVATRDLKIRVMPAGALAIITLSLPDAIVQSDYLTDLAANIVGGGAVSKPLSWSVVSGQLPPGLELVTHTDGVTGLVSGKPMVAGTYPLTVQVRDADGRTDTADFVVRIYSNALLVTYATTPPAVIHPGDDLELQVHSNSATTSTYRLYSGALPPGLALDETGKVSGTVEDAPTSVGVHSFVIEATDATGAKGLGAFNVEVTAKQVATGCGGSATGTEPFPFAVLAGLALGLLVVARRVRRT